MHHDICELLGSIDYNGIEEAIAYIEDVIDDIDDLNDSVNPYKDIISVTRSEYRESFPEHAEVFDTTATASEEVTNFKFDEISEQLKKSSVKNPVVITSVRKSDISNQLRFGRQYIVESADTDEDIIKINYEHEGSGEFVMPKEVAANLFTLCSLLTGKKYFIEKNYCIRYIS